MLLDKHKKGVKKNYKKVNEENRQKNKGLNSPFKKISSIIL